MNVLEKNLYKLKPMKITAMKVTFTSSYNVILNKHALQKKSMYEEINHLS